ncbi:MAG: hypothetical protein L3J06_05230 [Cyclobacteriaceae bacterium]|nr:hypothetical protein [Cyclobacteriaceae bacterium]
MKNVLTYTLLALTFFLFSFTKGGYETAMQNTIAEIYQAKKTTNLKAVANKFERIGAAEKGKWLPSYYTAYCYIMMTTVEEDLTKWDAYLDTADEVLEQTTKLKKANMVEILALKGFANMMRISVDPATRGQEYSMKSAGFLQQASQLDDQNPRVNLMMAQMLLGTARFFGKGREEACQKFANAKELFLKEETEGRGILPAWGKPQVESMLAKCSSSTKDK